MTEDLKRQKLKSSVFSVLENCQRYPVKVKRKIWEQTLTNF